MENLEHTVQIQVGGGATCRYHLPGGGVVARRLATRIVARTYQAQPSSLCAILRCHAFVFLYTTCFVGAWDRLQVMQYRSEAHRYLRSYGDAAKSNSDREVEKKDDDDSKK